MDGAIDGRMLRLRVLLIGQVRGWGGGAARRRSLAAPVLSPRSRPPSRLFIWRRLIVNDDSPKCSDRKLLITGVVCHLRDTLETHCVSASLRRHCGRFRELADPGPILSECP